MVQCHEDPYIKFDIYILENACLDRKSSTSWAINPKINTNQGSRNFATQLQSYCKVFVIIVNYTDQAHDNAELKEEEKM